jgi:hypothetical protein
VFLSFNFILLYYSCWCIMSSIFFINYYNLLPLLHRLYLLIYRLSCRCKSVHLVSVLSHYKSVYSSVLLHINS